MDFKVGDRVLRVREGDEVEGTVVKVDEGDSVPYLVRWDDEDFDTWMFASNVGAIPKELPDLVNHPAHYNTGKIEVIDFIEDQGLEYHEANAIKYIARAGKKNPNTRMEDLEKAIWYLTRKLGVLLKEDIDG